MTNLLKTLRKPIFTDQDGNQWKYYDYERDSYGMTAFYQSVSNPDVFIEVIVDFLSQEGETVSGYEYPDFQSYEINPGENGYDYGRAVSDALDEAHGIVRERMAA